jgi:hypothetical protein
MGRSKCNPTGYPLRYEYSQQQELRKLHIFTKPRLKGGEAEAEAEDRQRPSRRASSNLPSPLGNGSPTTSSRYCNHGLDHSQMRVAFVVADGKETNSIVYIGRLPGAIF